MRWLFLPLTSVWVAREPLLDRSAALGSLDYAPNSAVFAPTAGLVYSIFD